jgi:hypothetical protein
MRCCAQTKMPKVSALRIFILLVGLFALVITGSYVIRGFPVKRRSTQECFICRTEVNTRVRFNVLRKTQTNTSALATYLDREQLLHSHSFWPRVNIAHNILGQPCRTAKFRRHPLLGLSPELQLDYLTNTLAREAILPACLALTNEAAATSFRDDVERWAASVGRNE